MVYVCVGVVQGSYARNEETPKGFLKIKLKKYILMTCKFVEIFVIEF